MGYKSRGNFKTMSVEEYKKISWGKKEKDVFCSKCGGLICNGLAGDETFRVCEDCGRMDCE